MVRIRKYAFITLSCTLCLMPSWAQGMSSQDQDEHIDAPAMAMPSQHSETSENLSQSQEHYTPKKPVSEVFYALSFDVRKQFYYNGQYHIPHSVQDLREKLKNMAVTKLLFCANNNPNAHSKAKLSTLASTIHQGQGIKKPRPYQGDKENVTPTLNIALANVRDALTIDAESPTKFVRPDDAKATAESKLKREKIRKLSAQIEAAKSTPAFSSKPQIPAMFKPKGDAPAQNKSNKRKEPAE